MKFYAALVGGLAVFSAALPAVEDVKPTDLSIADNVPTHALPAVLVPDVAAIELRDVDSNADLEKRKSKGGSSKGGSGSGSKGGSGGKSSKKTSPTPTPKKTTPVKTTPVKTTAVKTTSVKASSKTSSIKTSSSKTSSTKTSQSASTRSGGSSSTKTGTTTKTGTATTTGTTTRTGTATTTGTITTLLTSTASSTATRSNIYCGPKTCGAKGCSAASSTKKPTKPTATPKKGTTTKAIRSFSDSVGEVARSLYYRAAYLVGRADAINLSGSQLESARAQGKALGKVKELHTGKYRYLKLGTPMLTPEAGQISRTPNDMSFDSWSGDEFFRTIDGLTGCTAVMVTSPKGIFAVHLWEQFIKTALPTVLSNLKKGSADQKAAGGFPSWNYKAQFGLSDYATGKVAKGAWGGSKDDIHIAIVAPSNDPKGKHITPKNTGIKSQAQWAGALKYGSEVKKILAAVKEVVGNVPDSNVVLYAYHQQSEDESAVSTNTDGTMTGYLNNGNYAIYGEDTKMFEFPVAAASGSGSDPADCDDSSDCKGSKCCIVMK